MPDETSLVGTGPTLIDRIKALEARLAKLESYEQRAHVMPLNEQSSAPTAPGSDKAKLYVKNSGGRSVLYLRDDVGEKEIGELPDPLDADTLCTYEPGYEDGDIPIGDGTLNENLNAHLVDGLPNTWEYVRHDSAQTYDDEFNSSTLDGDWTLAQSSCSYCINTNMPSAFRATIESTTGYLRLTKAISWPTSTINNLGAMFYAPLIYNNQFVDIEVWNDSACTQNGMIARLRKSSGSVQLAAIKIISGSWSDAVSPVSVAEHHGGIAICALETDGSNLWKFGIGFGGCSMIQLGTYSRSMAGNYLRIQCAHDTSGPSQRITYGIGWVRKSWAKVWG